jgi:phosphoribosylamine--glycine ligase
LIGGAARQRGAPTSLAWREADIKVCIVDTELAGLDFAIRCVEAGHEVQLFQQTKHPIGDGFKGVKRVTDLQASLKWCGKDGLILPTGNAKFLAELERWRDFGYPVFGPSYASAQLEIDREAGMKVMQAAGLDLPHYQMFNTLDEAEAFAMKANDPYVFKTMGSEEDKSLSFIAHDPAELVGWLRRQKARGMRLDSKCMLQEKIDMYCEMGVSMWCGPEGFINTPQIAFEHKKLMNEEIGPNTGEMITLCQYEEEEKMSDEMLKPLESVMVALKHVGDTAINCGIDKKGKAWPFELTQRLGWPAFYLQTATHKGDPVQWMRDLLDGKDSLSVDYRPSMGVVLAQPPWPQFNGKPECVDGNPVSGIDDVRDQIHPAMMMRAKGPVMRGDKVAEDMTYQTAGEMVCVATGVGTTVEKAKAKAYKAVKAVRFCDMEFRTDGGDKIVAVLDDLHRHGYALQMEAGV